MHEQESYRMLDVDRHKKSYNLTNLTDFTNLTNLTSKYVDIFFTEYFCS